jgi:hypothetical protein
VVKRIAGAALLLFGLIGAAVEFDNAAAAGSVDALGGVLAALFVLSGITLLSLGFSHLPPHRGSSSGNGESAAGSGRRSRPWQRPFLIITGSAELAVLLIGGGLAVLVGGHGFASGEMGTMIGMFAVMALLFVLPYAAARAAAVYGLWTRKRWGAKLTILLSALAVLAAVFIAGSAPLVFIIVLLYAAVSLWAALGWLGSFGPSRK